MAIKRFLLVALIMLEACASPKDPSIALPSLPGWLPHVARQSADQEFERGLAAFHRDHWREALDAFAAARTAGGSGYALDHYTGRAYLQLHQYREAISALERAAKERPEDVATQHALWQAYRGAGQPGNALSAFKKVVRLDPKQLTALRPKQVENERREREIATIGPPTKEIVFPEDSDDNLLAVPPQPPSDEPVASVPLPPSRPGRPALLSPTYDAAPPSSSAITVENDAPLAAAPAPTSDDTAATWIARGTALARSGRFEEAITAYREAESRDPKDPEIFNNLGNAYFALFRVDEARALYRHTLELDPDHVWGMNNLGYTYYATQDYDQAVQWFQRALAREPDHLFARMNLGVTFHAMGAYDAAIREFHRLLEDHPDTPKAYYNLGLSYTLKSDYAQARAAFETYLRLVPDAVERSYVEQILAGFEKSPS
jgi:tetratricopeptide (TPR) repeat protein